MSDVTKCPGTDCPIRDTCYRFTAPSSGLQSYQDFRYMLGCADHLPETRNASAEGPPRSRPDHLTDTDKMVPPSPTSNPRKAQP